MLHFSALCVNYSYYNLKQIAGTIEVFKGMVNKTYNIYQAGLNVVQVRVTQGSAVITTKSSNGEQNVHEAQYSVAWMQFMPTKQH